MAADHPSVGAPVEPSPEAMDRVAARALELVGDGMLLGLGTGRAAEAFIRRLGDRVAAGLAVTAVTTSERSEELARSCGIPLSTLAQLDRLDIAFDGADEVTPALELTKGRGGALVRERVVAHAARRFVVLVTPDKLVERLGSRMPVPIVVVPFAGPIVARALGALGGQATERRTGDGRPYRTDDGGLVLDTRFAPIEAPATLEQAVLAIPGVIDTGLFLSMAERVLVGWPDRVQELGR
jgi:ribose 5-phosphate isomerase A